MSIRLLIIYIQSGDKRLPEGPSSSKTLPPSAPRAMSSSDTSRGPKTDSAPTRDRDWKAQRDPAPHLGGGSAPQQSQPEPTVSAGGSLRSRISVAPANSYRPDSDDDRDSSRKRTVSGEYHIAICFSSFDLFVVRSRKRNQ